MNNKSWNLPLPPEDRSFFAKPKTAVAAAVLFSAVRNAHADAPHPAGLEWSNNLLDDRPGAGAASPEQSAQLDANWANTWDQVTSTYGLSVPYATDLPALLNQRRALVEGVIQGRVDLVEAALDEGADPNALVPVRHPNAAEGEDVYVTMPVGVAAVMFAERYKKAAKDSGVEGSPAVRNQVAAYERIAGRLLLDNEGRPTVRAGTAPDGHGVALSFYGWGMSQHNDPSVRQLPTPESKEMGHLTLVRHNEPINLGLVASLARISPDLLADQKLLPQLSGDDLLGDALPADNALRALARANQIQARAGQEGFPVPRTHVSPADQFIKDATAPAPRTFRP